jgi:hypothetical protein
MLRGLTFLACAISVVGQTFETRKAFAAPCGKAWPVVMTKLLDHPFFTVTGADKAGGLISLGPKQIFKLRDVGDKKPDEILWSFYLTITEPPRPVGIAVLFRASKSKLILVDLGENQCLIQINAEIETLTQRDYLQWIISKSSGKIESAFLASLGQ